jgi:hypothetical protein
MIGSASPSSDIRVLCSLRRFWAVSGKLEVGGIAKGIKEAYGYADILLEKASSNNILPVFKGKQLVINQAQFKADWDDGRLTLDKLTADAQNFTINLTGDARLNKKIQASVVDFRGKIQADPKKMYLNLIDPKARKTLKKNKKLEIRISDKLMKPTIRML